MRLIKAALIVAFVALAVSTVSAQSGGLTVQVVDSGGPLPGATVTISHPQQYVKATSELTGPDGTVQFPVLRPSASYIIDVEFPGFGRRRMPEVRVKIGEVTPLTVQLASEITEKVVVTTQSDVVDLEDTSQTTTFSDEFIQDLPVPGRFYQNVLTLAPGVQDSDGDGNPNVHGSRARDFKAVVSGISNVDPLTGGWMSRVNPNSIEEMEVITAGASVEFSRAQGGFARIIQKQGSNDFEGVFDLLYRSSKLDGNGARNLNKTSDPDFDTFQPGFQLSGPVVKDKLWFRFSHEYIDREDPIDVVTSTAVQTTEQTINSDQLTWQVSPRNKLAFQFQSDPLEITNLGVSSRVPVESTERWERSGETYSLTWTAPFSPKVLIDSQVAWQDLNFTRNPTQGGQSNNCIPDSGDSSLTWLVDSQCANNETQSVSGSFPLTWDDNRERLTVRSDATIFAGRFLGATHTFKLGFISENERYRRDLNIQPAIQVFLFDITGQDQEEGEETNPEIIGIINANIVVPDVSSVTATGNTWGLYFEDQIKPRSNMTVTWGLRVDREEINSNGKSYFDPEAELSEFSDRVGAGQSEVTAIQESFTAYEDISNFTLQIQRQLGLNTAPDLDSTANQSQFWDKTRRNDNINIANTNWAPFLSLAWDPWSNGKTSFSGTFRRYFDKVFLSVPLIELNPANTSVVLNAEPTPAGFVPTGLRQSVSAAVNVSIVDRNLETPYQDEWTVAFEREIFAETLMRVTYINRKFRDQLQDIDLNHVPGDFGRCLRPTINSALNILASPGMSDPNDPFRDDPGAGIIPWLTDPYTGELYPDTEPGIGDGFGDSGFDDCAGEAFIPEGQMTQDDPFASDVRLERPDGVPDLYLQNPGWGDIFFVSNLNQADYEGYVLEIIRRQYRSWEFQGSYTWSEAIGDGEDFNQVLGDDRSLRREEQGYQSYDQRHVVKFNATTITPWGFRLGGAVSWQSGLPFSLLNQRLSFDTTSPELLNFGTANPASTRTLYTNGQRNTERNDSYWNVDMKFTKEMNLSRGLNAQFSAEVFNLLNESVYQVYNPNRGGGGSGVQINGVNDARYHDFGRRYQMALKLAF